MLGSDLFPFAGHNEKLGWSLTVNYPDVIDVFVEEFDPENNDMYRHDENWKTVQKWKDKILVKQPDGDLKAVELRCEKTDHGPVFFRVKNKGYAVAVPKIQQGGLPQQLYQMAKAENLDQFRNAVATCSLAFHNIMYADVTGNIWYIYNCATPKRNDDVTWGKPVSGATSKHDWKGYHAISSLPQVLNPECGWMQNCNSSPFTTSKQGQNPVRSNFPTYIGRDDVDNNRVRISKHILESKPQHSFADLEKAAWSTFAIEAQRQINGLVDSVEKSDQKLNLDELISELKAWNQHVRVESVAATLFHLWYEKVAIAIYRDQLTSAQSVKALLEVKTELESQFGTWQVGYGEMFRHQRPDAEGNFGGDDAKSWPIAGGHPQVGMVFTFLSRKINQSKKRYGFHGHSFVSIVEFDPEGIRSKSLVPYGVSSDPDSPHYLDQAPLYAAGKFKESPFDFSEVKAKAKRIYHPGK